MKIMDCEQMVLTSSDDGWNHSRAKLVGMVDFHYFEYI